MRTTSGLFGVGKSTVCSIVNDFCIGIIKSLQGRYIQFPVTEEELESDARGFKNRVNLSQCVGVIDGCHIPITVPKQHAVGFHNYKG